MAKKIFLHIVFLLALMLSVFQSNAQNAFDFFNLQVQVYDTVERDIQPAVIFPFGITVTFSDSSHVVLYQETHTITAWNNGLVNLFVGAGTVSPTGLYTQLRNVPFEQGTGIKVESALFGSPQVLLDKPLLTLPFAALSLRNLQKLSTTDLTDIDTGTIPVAGYMLKWNGTKWVPMPDEFMPSDTLAQSHHTVYAPTADSSDFAWVAVPGLNTDTVAFANHAALATSVQHTQHAVYTPSANYAFTTQSADSILYGWNIYGNHGLVDYLLGTTDNQNVVLKSNNVKRLTIHGDSGWVGINADTSHAGLHFHGNNGFLYTPQSTATAFTNPSTLAGTPGILFSTDSVSFRGGLATGTQWSNSLRHRYTFSFGHNNISNGNYASVVFGDSCSIYAIPPPPLYTVDYTDGLAAMAFGKKCQTSGRMSLAAGYGSKANFFRGVALGYECVSEGNSAQHAIGYRAYCKGSNTLALGTYVKATGHKSFAIGSYASTNARNGCFVYGDHSTTDTVKNTAINQFMVRAAGGTIFYTDMNATTGVELMSGSGSWSMLSDSTKKIGISLVDPLALMQKFGNLQVKTWSYLTQQGITHMGPMSQDFFNAYGFGYGNTSIDMVDADGLTMALIQALRKNQLYHQEKLNQAGESIRESFRELDYDALNSKIDEIINHLNK